ncbi:MAG: clan AA aspartic protease [Flavobacteriales bacterium]|nr:clan AA aspartic protease [Flavobacteriales bacterium]HRN42068.1 retropepsin-like aspartic protease [Vicingus sp.]HRP60206.1 retropepsin-like aspartic protease [Vicingus sp.]
MTTNLPLTIQAIENDGYHLLTTILINGKNALIIIDTGASRSVFDETRIIDFIGHNNLSEHDKLSSGLGTNTMTSKKVVLDTLNLNGLVLNHYEATILNLHHVNQSYQKIGLNPIDGILGGDVLNDYHAIIDYKNSILTLSF